MYRLSVVLLPSKSSHMSYVLIFLIFSPLLLIISTLLNPGGNAMSRFRHEPTDPNALWAIRVYVEGGWKAVGSCEKRAVGLNPWLPGDNTKAAFRCAAGAVLKRLSGDDLVEQADDLVLGQDTLAH